MKIFRKIHLWLSVPFGLIITLICFSGATLIFEPEITRSIKSDVYYVSSSEGDPLPMNELMQRLETSLPDSVSVTGVTLFADKNRTYRVNLSNSGTGLVFVDQYSGRITGTDERLGFFTTMLRLHRWLLDDTPRGEGIKVGKLIVGISTIMFVITLITGVVIWWPRARKNFRRSLSLYIKKGWRAFWMSLHVAGGMYALVLVLVMALTGLTWSFDWYRDAFYAVCGVPQTSQNTSATTSDGKSAKPTKENLSKNGNPSGKNNTKENLSKGVNPSGRSNNKPEKVDNLGKIKGFDKSNGDDTDKSSDSKYKDWQRVADAIKSQYPDAPQITIGPKTVTVNISATGNPRASDIYLYSKTTAELTPLKKYVDSTPADRLRGWIYAIHTGTWGGLLTRILWFIGALLAATLPLTGYYLWLKRLSPKTSRKLH